MTLIKPLRKPFRSRQRKHGLQPSKRRRARNLRGSVCPPTAAMPAKRRSPSKSSNPTGSSESRFAKITIVCGSYRIAIEIEQKGHGSDNPDNPNDPDDPDTPPTDYKYVARVDYKLTDNREEGATTTVSQSFDYDEENRVARITENYHSTDEYSYKDNGTEIYTFDYTIANEVSVRQPMRRSAFSTKFPPKPTRKDASPKLRVTTTTTGHPGSKGRRPIHTPRKDVSLPCYPSIPIPLPAA